MEKIDYCLCYSKFVDVEKRKHYFITQSFHYHFLTFQIFNDQIDQSYINFSFHFQLRFLFESYF